MNNAFVYIYISVSFFYFFDKNFNIKSKESPTKQIKSGRRRFLLAKFFFYFWSLFALCWSQLNFCFVFVYHNKVESENNSLEVLLFCKRFLFNFANSRVKPTVEMRRKKSQKLVCYKCCSIKIEILIWAVEKIEDFSIARDKHQTQQYSKSNSMLHYVHQLSTR